MPPIRLLILSFALFGWSAGPASAEPATLRMDWDKLGSRVAGKRIGLILPGTACNIEGLVTGINPDGLNLQVVKTSDPSSCPKGTRNVPRKDVRAVRLIGARGARVGLAILGAVGGYGAAVAGTFARGDEFSVGGGQVALFTAGALGGAVGGYYLGKHLSRDADIIVD